MDKQKALKWLYLTSESKNQNMLDHNCDHKNVAHSGLRKKKQAKRKYSESKKQKQSKEKVTHAKVTESDDLQCVTEKCNRVKKAKTTLTQKKKEEPTIE